MEQESKSIQPTQKEIDDTVEQLLRRAESPKEKAWREMEEQMESPAGMQGLKIKTKKEIDFVKIEKKQAFFKEYHKWREDYLLNGAISIKDLPIYLDPDTEFKNENDFSVDIEFIDYLVANTFDGADGEFAEELKTMLQELKEIEFKDIFEMANRLVLFLESEDARIILLFEDKYPFKFATGKASHLE